MTGKSRMNDPKYDVAVIGAGLSGLSAALTAHDAGARIVVLEAANRVGGRIHAVFDDDEEPIADLGPTWVWPPYQPVVARWIRNLGLTTFDQFNDGDAVIEGYGPAIQHQPLPGQHGMVRIAGGPHAMIAAAASHLPNGTLRTGTQVSAITETKTDSLRLSLCHESRPVFADRVVLAVPPRVAAGTIAMPQVSGGVVETMRHIPTWMATQTKVVAIYRRAFWRTAGLSGRIASRLGPLVEVHDHCAHDGTAALFGFAEAASAPRNPDKFRADVLAQLARCLGPEAGTPQRLIVQDWATDPLICTGQDRVGPPVHPDVGPPALRHAHLNGKLWLAASETSQLSPGLIEGAINAGEQAAISAVKSLGL